MKTFSHSVYLNTEDKELQAEIRMHSNNPNRIIIKSPAPIVNLDIKELEIALQQLKNMLIYSNTLTGEQNGNTNQFPDRINCLNTTTILTERTASSTTGIDLRSIPGDPCS